MVPWRRVLGVVMVALQAVGVACHGFMAEPAARNVQHNSDSCAHCLSAGGPGVTFAGGRSWPNAKHGVCGDAHNGPRHHEAGGKFATPPRVAATYIQGQTISIRVKVTAPHGGRFSFGLCPVPRGASAEAERAATTQKCIDSNPLTNAADGSKYWWFGKRGNGEYVMQFKLPPAIVCDRCTLQWHWETANSCTYANTPPQHVMSPNMTPCTQSGPEEFWNCADVSVLKTGSKLPATAAAQQKRAAAPGLTSTMGSDPAGDKHLREARALQAAALRKQAASMPEPFRSQLMAQAKSLDAQAKGGAGEGFLDFLGVGGTSAAHRAGGGGGGASNEMWVVVVLAVVAALAIPWVVPPRALASGGVHLAVALAAAALTAGVMWRFSPACGTRDGKAHATDSDSDSSDSDSSSDSSDSSSSDDDYFS